MWWDLYATPPGSSLWRDAPTRVTPSLPRRLLLPLFVLTRVLRVAACWRARDLSYSSLAIGMLLTLAALTLVYHRQ